MAGSFNDFSLGTSSFTFLRREPDKSAVFMLRAEKEPSTFLLFL